MHGQPSTSSISWRNASDAAGSPCVMNAIRGAALKPLSQRMISSDRAAARELPVLIERDRPQTLESSLRILLRIVRQGRLVLREAMPVRELGVLLLQMPRVSQED